MHAPEQAKPMAPSLKCLNFEVALTISGIIMSASIETLYKDSCFGSSRRKFSNVFLDISFFGLTYPFLEGRGGGKMPDALKKFTYPV